MFLQLNLRFGHSLIVITIIDGLHYSHFYTISRRTNLKVTQELGEYIRNIQHIGVQFSQ